MALNSIYVTLTNALTISEPLTALRETRSEPLRAFPATYVQCPTPRAPTDITADDARVPTAYRARERAHAQKKKEQEREPGREKEWERER